MFLAFVAALAGEPNRLRPGAVCWVAEGRVVAVATWSGPVEDAPIPGHISKNAFPDACPASVEEGDYYLGRNNYDRPEPLLPEPTVEDRVAEHADDIAAVDAKASATDAKVLDNAARIAALEAQVAALTAELERLRR